MQKLTVFLMPTNIGDFILATPVMRFLEEEDGLWLVFGGKNALPLIRKHLKVVKSWPVEKFRGTRGRIRLYRLLKRRKITTLVDMRLTALPFLISAEKKYYRFKRGTGHALHDYFSVLGKERPRKFPGFLLYTTEQDLLNVKEKMKLAGIGRANILIGLNPDANWEHKRWSVEKWVSLIELIRKKHPEAKFVVTGINRLLPEMPDVYDLSGKLTLRELAELIKNFNIYISNDSGPMHLSSAVGTKTLGIFGPSQPHRYAPFGRENEFFKNQVKCTVCKVTECDREFWCLKNTSPEKIAEMALDMLDR